jgi:hypothetical protein
MPLWAAIQPGTPAANFGVSDVPHRMHEFRLRNFARAIISILMPESDPSALLISLRVFITNTSFEANASIGPVDGHSAPGARGDLVLESRFAIMFIDARKLAGAEIRTSVCIVGGGVAGITLALELAKQRNEVTILESGGFRPDQKTRQLYRGQNVGLPYNFADGYRMRFLGGSSAGWGGWCAPWDPEDFETRPWVANSGWPFGLDELEPYYEGAHTVLQLGSKNYDPAFWERAIGHPFVRRMPLTGGKVRDVVSQFSPPPVSVRHTGAPYGFQSSFASFSMLTLQT